MANIFVIYGDTVYQFTSAFSPSGRDIFARHQFVDAIIAMTRRNQSLLALLVLICALHYFGKCPKRVQPAITNEMVIRVKVAKFIILMGFFC